MSLVFRRAVDFGLRSQSSQYIRRIASSACETEGKHYKYLFSTAATAVAVEREREREREEGLQ